MVTLPHVGLRPTVPCGRRPANQQKVHEYEVLRDDNRRYLLLPADFIQ